MLDISLAVRVSREGETGVRNDARGDVSFNVLAVKVLLGSVSGTKVVDERTNFDALGSLPSSVLHESSEGSGTTVKRMVSTHIFIQLKEIQFLDVPCTKTGHDDRLLVVRRKLHNGRFDGHGNLGSGLEGSQVPGTLTESRRTY